MRAWRQEWLSFAAKIFKQYHSYTIYTNSVTFGKFPFIFINQLKMSKADSFWSVRLEYYAFLIIGSLLWWFSAYKILNWLKFPFHLYPFEIYAIFIIPVLLLGLLLNITDRTMQSKEDWSMKMVDFSLLSFRNVQT